MKQTILGVLMSVAMSGAIVAAQDGRVPSPGASPSQPPAPSQPAPRDPAPAAPSASSASESTITGCLVQGSGPTVFLLQDAKVSAAAPAAGASAQASGADASARASMDHGMTYRLESESGAKGVDFKTYLNRQVSITGKLDAKASTIAMPQDRSQKIDEKTLGKVTATSLTKLADTCSAIG